MRRYSHSEGGSGEIRGLRNTRERIAVVARERIFLARQICLWERGLQWHNGSGRNWPWRGLQFPRLESRDKFRLREVGRKWLVRRLESAQIFAGSDILKSECRDESRFVHRSVASALKDPAEEVLFKQLEINSKKFRYLELDSVETFSETFRQEVDSSFSPPSLVEEEDN